MSTQEKLIEKKKISKENNEKVSILSRLICCCFFKKNNNIKNEEYEKWKNNLSVEKEKKELLDPFDIILDIYKKKVDIDKFYKIRINPNFISDGQRNDIEFYVPQIADLLLSENPFELEELFSIILKICYYSYFFTHRIIWYLSCIKFRLEKSEESFIQKEECNKR